MTTHASPVSTPREAVERWLSTAVWSRVVECLAAYPQHVYLVGGTLRDAILGVRAKDLDIAVEGDAIGLGRHLAESLHGSFYAMDRAHGVGRVILQHGHERYHIDLASLRGATIMDDLQARDLTINAMGMSLSRGLGELLDPTGGYRDLGEHIIRHAYTNAFVDDPVRMLRAVRLGGALGFAMHPSTREMISEQRVLLATASLERVRDELFMLLGQPAVAGLSLALELELLPLVLEPLTANQLESGLQWVNALQGAMAGEDSRLRRLAACWEEEFVPDRPRYALVSLAALMGEAEEQTWRPVRERLRLAGREDAHLYGVLKALHSPLWSAAGRQRPLDMHRYYREFGAAGVDAAALVLARAALPRCQTAEDLLAAWMDAREQIVQPLPLLTGQDLVSDLGLEPGPVVGALLEQLVEAQVQGAVSGPEEAQAWVRAALARYEHEGKQVGARC